MQNVENLEGKELEELAQSYGLKIANEVTNLMNTNNNNNNNLTKTEAIKEIIDGN